MDSFVQWWQHIPSHINPAIFSIGRFPVKWYGLMYLVAFGVLYLLCLWRVKAERLPWDRKYIGDMIFWFIFGTLLGGRLGSAVFYDIGRLFTDPMVVLSPIQKVNGHWMLTGVAGMSYHGGVIGVVVAVWLFSRRRGAPTLFSLDFITLPAALVYTFGRLGNFLNGELFGRVTTAAIGMYFPASHDGLLRHPSQLYEATFEGPFLFSILWFVRKRAPYPGFLFGVYLFGYGLIRFFVEFFREPDAPWGLLFWGLSMGQILCAAQMLVALAWLFVTSKVNAAPAPVAAAPSVSRRKPR